MKTTKILLILIALAGIAGTACDELLADLLKFNTEWYTIDFTIDPTDVVGENIFKSEEFEADLDTLLEEHGMTKEEIRSAKLSDAKITINTSGSNFDPVENIEVFVETTDLGSVRVAWLDTIPPGATILELKLSEEDLQEYLYETKFKVTAAGNLKNKVDKIIDLTGEFRWVIVGKLN